MNKLPTAASDNTRGIKPPSTWQEFQSFCLDAFPLVQEKFSTGRHRTANYWASSGYGKNGDLQHGVDIFDHFSATTMQCKRVEKFDLKDLKKELKALKGYRTPLSAYFIVTSLEETNRTVIDEVEQHNALLENDTHAGQVLPMLPEIRLPKVYVLNWPEIKAILCADIFLALKWGFLPSHPHYYNLNGVDLSKLIGAANSMGCSLPPGGGGKSLRVLETIAILTRPLNVDAIAALGDSDTIASSTIQGLWRFLELVDEIRNVGRRVKPALLACESLDGVSVQRGLSALNDIVNFQGRLEAFKYLNRIADMVRRLVRQLDTEHFFEFGQKEFDYEHFSEVDTDYSIRYYNFSDINADTPPWYICGKQLRENARFIAHEIRKVRVNIPHSTIWF